VFGLTWRDVVVLSVRRLRRGGAVRHPRRL